MTNQAPEEFIHALIERYDIEPAEKPFVLGLGDINKLANAEAVLQSRADEIDALNRMLDQQTDKLAKLEERYISQTQAVNTLSKELQDARNAINSMSHQTEPHDTILAKLKEAEWALKVVLHVESIDFNTYLVERALDKVFGELRLQLTQDSSDIPF